jgi:hypothetical protein
MSQLKASLFVALASAIFTAGCFYFVHYRRAAEAAGLRNANNRMRFQASQRQQAQTQEDTPMAADVVVAPASDPMIARAGTPVPNPAPIGDYRNEGQATPLATLQTFAWACDRGDTETVAKLLCFDGASRVKAESYLATLPEKIRAPWNSPEEMVATLLTSTNMKSPFPNATILAKAAITQISEERVMLRLPGTLKDRTEYQKSGGIWKYVITEAMIDAYMAQAKAEPPPAQ